MTLLSSCSGKQGATSLDSAFSLLVTITVIAVLASLTAVVWGYWKWKQMTDLIKDLSRTAEAIAGGDLTRRTDVPQHGSHRQLAENFNKMADAYQKVIKGQEVEIVDQTKALARSNEEFQQLSYVVSHDLQEPLRAINGYLQLLKQRHKNAIPTEAKEYIDRSIAATTRMRGQIEALLSYTQLESKGRPFEEVNVAELISQVLSNLECHQVPRHKSSTSLRRCRPGYLERIFYIHCSGQRDWDRRNIPGKDLCYLPAPAHTG